MPWAPQLGSRIQYNTLQSANPDHDMLPTGLFCIYLRQGVAHILRPDATLIGRLAKARLDQLYQGFTKTQHNATCLIRPVCRGSGSSAIYTKMDTRSRLQARPSYTTIGLLLTPTCMHL